MHTTPDIAKLGSRPPLSLIDARLQLHHAAQILQAAADALLTNQPDDSHAALNFHADSAALSTQPLPNDYTLSLILPTPLLMLTDASQNIITETPLLGLTIADALDWTARQLEHFLPSHPTPPDIQLRLRNYELPFHHVLEDEPFRLKYPHHFDEVARYFSFAHRLLDLFTRNLPNTSPIHVWPHHFDIATLIYLDPDMPPQKSRTIGLGLSPGDKHIPAPYLYITPYPTNNINPNTLPTPPHHTAWASTFLGLTIPATEILAIPHEHRIPTLIETLTQSTILTRQLLSNT
ncbi:hypothetical protein KS4_36250 [Poriferisphaera corsica]|uniref:Uncharacterized protein n=1 Tax=Poriferisphaera corsica TaxID=2528020 RepID=A0A517YZ86_9BACT|nr:hypothetical protein [Poriferisphaera corsica]QDU35542.1 hypothetical protein KS4_36250 [Poriferisphaera corsica]